MIRLIWLFILTNSFLLGGVLYAQPTVRVNNEKTTVESLPDLLTLKHGEPVNSPEVWERLKRPELLHLFKNEVYGMVPDGDPIPSSIEVIEESDAAFNNKAHRIQFALDFKKGHRNLRVHILLYLPKDVLNPPVFLGYNFYGNHTVVHDDNVLISNSWVRNNETLDVYNHKADQKSRGKRSYRWPVDKILQEGFGIATVYYGDIDPDRNDFTDGIHPFFYKEGQDEPGLNEWGSLTAWAWGLSRILDCLKGYEATADSKYILFGHSRLGKTVLWASALDQRFDMVIANNSGCGGAALFRRKNGETIQLINNRFPHWFSKSFKKYNDKEAMLPLDQHMLIALNAPRPVYIASAIKDKWADPEGEYLSAYYASPVYELYNKRGLSDRNFPDVNKPIHQTIGYHVRSGKHDVTAYDWKQFMIFAKGHLND